MMYYRQRQRILRKTTLLIVSLLCVLLMFKIMSYIGYTHHPHTPPVRIIRHEIEIPDEANATRLKPLQKYQNYLTIRFQGRLGNMMFLYASLMGLADINYMIPCLPRSNFLQEIYPLLIENCPEEEGLIDEWPKFTEHRFAAYDHRSHKLNQGVNVELVGFFQSWKYFENIKDRIREQFIFNVLVVKMSRQFLVDAARRFYPGFADTSDVVYVGIHVRRGDMMEDYNLERGYTVADIDYVNAAMSHFKSKYSQQKLIFVVCSDDMEWSETKLNTDLAPVIFSIFDDLELDLSLLSQTNHTIITVGTYGWWGAWLANGETTYYRNYPIQGSSIDANVEPKEYFYKNWIAL